MVDFKGTGSLQTSDLPGIHHVIQNTMLSYPKELVIGVLRDEFSRDSYYHYVKDAWGFPYTPDHTDLPADAGLNDDSTTRVFIAEKFRFDVPYYPAVLVSMGNTAYVPVSFNRNKENVLYEAITVVDGYGNERVYTTPTHFTLAGAWEGTLNIEVSALGIRERDDLVEMISLICTDIRHDEFYKSGLFIKRTSVGSPTESEDRNSKLHKQTISLDVRSEWRRHIPVGNIVDAINICVDFGNLETRPFAVAPNIQINTAVDLLTEIQDL